MQVCIRHINFLLAVVLLFTASHIPAAAHTSVLRNGSFTDGLNEWMVNSEFGDWNPLTADLAAKLYPPRESFKCVVLYQNLNVTDVSGKSFLAYLWLRKVRAWGGRTVAAYVDYLDTSGHLQRIKVLDPENDSTVYQEWTPFSSTFSFPANASRLVKFSLAKEDYGDFDVDGVMLLADAVVPVGAPHQIQSVSADQGPYGSLLTINGVNFGANASGKGRVSIGGSSDGVVVQSWSGSQVVVRVQEPARSGPIYVIADDAESSGSFSYTVTSPHFTIDVINPELSVIQGQAARFVVRANFLNGFIARDGISFVVPEAPAGSVTFSPVSLNNHGGVLASIATSGLAPGTYRWHVQSVAGGSAARCAPLTLKVVNVSEIEFCTRGTLGERTVLSSLSITKQQRVYVYCTAITSEGERLPDDTPFTLTCTSPYLEVFPIQWGGYEIYSAASVTTSFTASYPDGYSEALPVTVSLPSSPQVQTIDLSPNQVTNRGDQTITFSTTATGPVDACCDYTLGSLVDYSYAWSNGDKTFTASGRVPEGVEPGDYLFHAWIRSDPQTERVTRLTVVGDPDRGMLKGSVFVLETGLWYDTTGVLELYDSAGGKVGEHQLSAPCDFTVPYVPVGTYRLRFVPGDGLESQWYANSYAHTAACPVTVTPDGIVEDVYFFLSRANTQPLAVSNTDPTGGAANVPADKAVTAVFNKPVDTATITTSTFRLEDGAGNPVAGSVTCDGINGTFEPSADLSPEVKYTATITTGVKDTDGGAMMTNYTWTFTTSSNSFADAKLLPDGAPVSLTGKALYYVQGTFGYIEEFNRASGIRIEGSITGAEGDVVSVSGTMQTTGGGERYIQVDSMSTTGSAETRPLGANMRTLKTDLMSGLYVTAWGRVSLGSVTSSSFVINDGSDAEGLMIRTASPPSVAEGQFVVVTGAAGFDGVRVIYSK
ncbi:MAG TPA: Ig-like domain-containing protein [Armatimonadota bacterium]|nr:Ig-like domain-containing protein [Armatimonadota bacterium]